LKSRVILAAFAILLGFAACKKQDGNIIIDGQSNNNQLEIFRTDTFTLQAKTVREDSLPGNGISYTLLGEMHDPILGKSKASLFAKMTILEPENNFPNSIEPDSAILYIPMVDGLNFYGNPLTKQRLQVFTLNETINNARVYYQHETIAVNQQISSSYFGLMFQQNLIRLDTKKKNWD